MMNRVLTWQITGIAEAMRRALDATAKTVETTRQPDPAWKKAVLEANGNRCGWVENGYQCGHTTANGNLEPKTYGSMKPEDCIVLCPKHMDATEGA